MKVSVGQMIGLVCIAVLGISVVQVLIQVNTPDPGTQRLAEITEIAEEMAVNSLDYQAMLCTASPGSNDCIELESRKQEYKANYGKDYVYDQKRVDDGDTRFLQKLSSGCSQGNSKDCENLEVNLYLRFGKRDLMQESCSGGQQKACDNVKEIDKYLVR
jgi:hypothetical protein